MLIYDYAVTFAFEVRLFWRRKWTRATLLFFFNRYLSLFISIFEIAIPVSLSDAVSLFSPSYNLNELMAYTRKT